MKIAIAGRPGAGKSALYDLLAFHAAAAAEASGRPGAGSRAGSGGRSAAESGRGGVRIVHVEVPDVRLMELSRAYRPRKTTPARLALEELEQKSGPTYPALTPERRDMLAQAELILLVISLYQEAPEGWEAEALRQWRQAHEEYALIDLAVVETRLQRLEKSLKIGQPPNFPGEHEALLRLRERLESGLPVAGLDLPPEQQRGLRGFSFLTARPVLPAFNIDEAHLADAEGHPERVVRALGLATGENGGAPWVLFSAEVERQILELPSAERAPFLEAYGLTEPAADQIIRAAYTLAGLASFFTVGDDEVRAWTIRQGMTAPQAAGVIHSDLEKGFVRAEVLPFEAWKACGSEAAAKEKGLARLEGREYVVRDGDILHIRSGLAKGGRG